MNVWFCTFATLWLIIMVCHHIIAIATLDKVDCCTSGLELNLM